MPFANGLKSLGIGKGDMVTIYMPMIPEAAVAMLACARIGAPHSVVFGGFSPESVAGRVEDCGSKLIITADEGPARRAQGAAEGQRRSGAGPAQAGHRQNVVVVRRTGGNIGWQDGRDVWYEELVADQPAECPPEEMGAEDTLFILYTSGSTGKPKGVLHTTGGYMVFASMTHEYVFDYQRRRHLLVHRRRRLGDGPQLHRLRPAGQRRHHADVRGRAELPGHLAASGRWSTSTR
jgi:acetyl-CoA synthetase